MELTPLEGLLGEAGDVEMGAMLVWLRPNEEWEVLSSRIITLSFCARTEVRHFLPLRP